MQNSNIKTKAIIFDFMGVLLFVRKNYKPDKMIDEIDREIGKVTNDNLFKEKIKQKFNLDEKEFDNVLDKIVNKYEPFKLIWDLLPELKKKYKLAILNNGTALTLSRFGKKQDLDTQFDLFISSATCGMKKPDNDIYLLTAKKLEVNPKECLFMDDSKQNIGGAKKCGMKTIWWKDQRTGLSEFENFLASNYNI